MRMGPQIHDRLRERLKAKLGVELPEIQTDLTQSSIDRFFWSKSTKFLGYRGGAVPIAGSIIGGTHLVLAIVFGIVSVTIKTIPPILPVVLGITGVSVLIGTLWYTLRSKKAIQPEVRMSSSGRKLLFKIGQHIGWHDHDAWQQRSGSPWSTWWQTIVGIKTASNVLTPKSAELLEEGCKEYNRITGLLKLAKDSKGRSSTLAPQIQAAGDEAMISLINQVALLEETPETQNAIIAQCTENVLKLKELAERFEEILSGPVTLADRLSSTTVMDNLLDQMRMEAQAHEELRIMDRQD